jgi:septum formation protein
MGPGLVPLIPWLLATRSGDVASACLPRRITASTPLLLGSASPRRRELLATARMPLVVVSAEIDETVSPMEAPDAYLTRVVAAKLTAVLDVLSPEQRGSAPAVLAADTSVIDGASILGKPASRSDALEMIERLAGRTHEVKTRFAIADPSSGIVRHAETISTKVTFRSLTAEEARLYADSGEGHDKAGGYAVQGLGASFVQRIEGSYTNVVGLPVCEVVVALQRLGLT